MTIDGISKAMNIRRKNIAQHCLAAIGGLLLAWLFKDFPFADAVAPFSWSLVATGVGITGLFFRTARRAWLPILLLLAGYAVPAIWSAATGSSLAALTWLPLMMAAMLLSALSPAFLLAATGAMAFQYTGALAVLKNDITGFPVSGSVSYFLGFVGAAGALLWTSVAVNVIQKVRYWELVYARAVIMSAMLAWFALASGARAAVLALIAAAVVYVVRAVIRSLTLHKPLRRTLAVLSMVLLFIPLADLGITGFYTPGSTSTVWPILVKRSEATQRELDPGRETGSMRTRLQFWRQAGLALLTRPQGHGPASYTYVSLEYQDKPMVWSGSPHNFLALAAVEGGWLHLTVWLVVLVIAVYRAARCSGAALAMLAAGSVVMSFDVFSSQPIQNLLWLAIVGRGIGAGRATTFKTSNTSQISAGAGLLVTLGAGLAAAVLFYVPCDRDCDPIKRFRGHPASNTATLAELEANPTDGRWDDFREYYPLWFGLEQRWANAKLRTGDVDGYLQLIQHYPYHSVDN